MGGKQMAKGENIFKRKDGRWEGRYIKGYDKNRKIKYGYCYGHSYREAKEKVTVAKAQMYIKPAVNKFKAETNQIKMDEFCKKWLEIHKNKLKASSYFKYEAIINNHLIPAFGNDRIYEITTEDIAAFTEYLLSEEHLAIKTVRDILQLLHSIFIYDCERNGGQTSPIKIVYPKEERKELRVLDQSEQKRLMEYLQIDTDLYKLGVMIALSTGLRVGEICGLRWKNISFESRTLSVTSTVQRIKDASGSEHKTVVKIGTPKSKSSIRTIPLSEGLLQYCARFRSSDEETFILTGTTSYTEPRLLQRKLNSYYRKCGIINAHFHTLRHTFATRCVEVGCDIKSLSEILGHSSTVITMNRYVHPDLNLKRENIRKLEMAGYGYTVK